jgi:hypothetical protein
MEKRYKLIGQMPMENLPLQSSVHTGDSVSASRLAQDQGVGVQVKREGGTKMLSHARNAIRDWNVAK